MNRLAPTPYVQDETRWTVTPHVLISHLPDRRLSRLARYSIIFGSCGAVWLVAAGVALWLWPR